MKVKQSIKQIFAIGIGFILILLFNFFYPNLLNNYKDILLLAVTLLIVKFTVGLNFKRDASDKRVIRNILIYLFIYYFITYLSGLFIGFNRSIYNYTVSNITKNIIPTLIVIVLTEILRNQLIQKSNKDKKICLLTFFMFTLFEISVAFSYYDLSFSNDIYQFFGVVVLGGIVKNVFLTVLNTKTDYVPGIIYRIIMEETKYIILITPALGVYISSVCLILLPVTLTFMIVNTEKRQIKEKPKDINKFRFIYITVTILLIFMVLINAGVLKYQSLVIGSNSMIEYVSRGDVIIIEKLNDRQKEKVQIGEVLVFKYGNKIISHRVTKIVERPDAVYYRTKGDNNKEEDIALVETRNVIGVVKFKIKYIGLPTIWLSDLVK